MKDISALHQQLAQKAGISVLLGSLTWVVLLARGAAALRGQTGDAEHAVTFGPFVLNYISRLETNDGFTARFSFESGLFWYMLAWLFCGILLGLLFTAVANRKHR